ncbi:hypothetical protein LPU83_pLPU83c_0753 (plasmid) [Rhizobium favelukesii]|uniref:Uncharacterized protein n=1 Tax=Rhizobium favelukesii TaxID=348824 RepID=W6RM61_9HYPH|nr:hypothetical protein LPU83_pLPU83c_0753 [Rhizobium favelukesii]
MGWRLRENAVVYALTFIQSWADRIVPVVVLTELVRWTCSNGAR